MILSCTQYAIQALIYMAAQSPGVAVLNCTIAEYLGSSPIWLAKFSRNYAEATCFIPFAASRAASA
jgi:DNA-binding IscR family transcriptional regulator